MLYNMITEKSMNYRKATLNDLDKFHAFFTKRLKKDFLRSRDNPDNYSALTIEYLYNEQFNKKYFTDKIKSGNKIVYLALDNREIIGFLVVETIDGGVSFGLWLAVDEDQRGKGVASSLLKLWEKEVIDWGGHNIYLYTEKRNLQFYKKRGFTFIGLIPKSWFGSDHYLFHKIIQEPKEENYLRVSSPRKRKQERITFGRTRAEIANIIRGVYKGFKKRLELFGVGYSVKIEGEKIIMALGYSHPILLDKPKDIVLEINKNEILISGINKENVGQFAAHIHDLKRAEPYKGKGFRYTDEVIKRKVGKAALKTESEAAK